MLKVTIEKFRAHKKNTLIGFCNVELVDLGMIIKDCTVHQREGTTWISLPSRSYENNEGETVWTDIVIFSDREKRDVFQTAAVSAFHSFMGKEYNETTSAPPETQENDDIPF